MRVPPPYLLIAAAAIISMASRGFAATEAMTDPVGFITLAAPGGALSNPKVSLLSPTLTRPIQWQGAILSVSANTTGPTTITVSGNPWSSNQFNGANGSFFVEIVSAANPGVLSDITATTSTTITTSDNLRAFGATGDSIKIRKHVTIGDVFGANNSAGLYSTDDPSTADEVLIFDGANSVSYFYYIGDLTDPAGWYDSAFTAPAANRPIGPNEGMMIKRKSAGGLNIVYTGAVKTGNTVFPIVPGKNVLGTVSARGFTLATSGLTSTPFTRSDDPSTGDEVIIFTASGPTSYFYYTGDANDPEGWYDSAFTGSAANVTIQPGTSFMINRKSGVAFNWPLPSPTSF